MTSSLPIVTLMQTLAQSRPVFHSEADFQHAFAWELQKMFPHAQVRLELPVVAGGERMHVDIWVVIDGQPYAIELKYKKRALDATVGSERFLLKNDGAQDLGRYDFIKDIVRLERISAHMPQVEGYAIILTNDSGYWTGSAGTIDAAFRLPDGRTLNGALSWGLAASKGTTATREQALNLGGSHRILWNDYAQLAAPPTLLRWLGIHVQVAA
jgi:hypothetical protein